MFPRKFFDKFVTYRRISDKWL